MGFRAHSPLRAVYERCAIPTPRPEGFKGVSGGVIQLKPGANASSQREGIRFRGRNRADAKRKALNFWYINQSRLRLNLRDFSAQCRLLSDEKTIVFYSETLSDV